MFPVNTALVTDSQGRLRHLVEEFWRVCKNSKLRENESKSKVMICTWMMVDGNMNVALNGNLLEKVECLKF